MKNIGFLSITCALVLAASTANAADEFGDRFYGQAPAALGATPQEQLLADEEAAKALQDIMPAAGDEEIVPDNQTTPQDAAQEDQPQQDNAVQP